MKPSIKLMPEFASEPVWSTTPGREGPVNTDSLPVSDGLKSALKKWADWFDSTYDEDPAHPSFASPEAEAEFNRMGKELEARLKTELGDKIKVE